MNILTSLRIKVREELNPYFAPYRRRKLLPENQNFTILSNDCWAGHVYRYFGLPYNTPTIGTGFFAEDYLKFVSNLNYYLNLDLERMDVRDSSHYESIKKGSPIFLECPYAKLGDIELRFGHYKTFEEAYLKWNKRKERMNLNNLVVKMSEHNDCTFEILKCFDGLDYQKKLIFTTRDYGLLSQVIYKEYEGKDDIKNGTTNFRRYINLENLINGLPFKKY